MQLGLIGLGKMGMNMAYRLLEGGHHLVVYNRSQEKMLPIAEAGGKGANTPLQLIEKLSSPRIVWLMLPAGQPVHDMVTILSSSLQPGDILVDGGNSHYQEDLPRQKMLAAKKIHYLDIGVSGGIWGRSNGYCLMVGGEKAIFSHVEPILKTLAPPNGYLYCGGTGAGHYTKMIHNGIEYALMEAYGEGFELLKASPYASELELSKIAQLWNQGSVIRSWLLELLATTLSQDENLADIEGVVEDSGEGRWTVEQAIAASVPIPTIALALFRRFQSQQSSSFSNKILAALRQQFGGHAVSKHGPDEKG